MRTDNALIIMLVMNLIWGGFAVYLNSWWHNYCQELNDSWAEICDKQVEEIIDYYERFRESDEKSS